MGGGTVSTADATMHSVSSPSHLPSVLGMALTASERDCLHGTNMGAVSHPAMLMVLWMGWQWAAPYPPLIGAYVLVCAAAPLLQAREWYGRNRGVPWEGKESHHPGAKFLGVQHVDACCVCS